MFWTGLGGGNVGERQTEDRVRRLDFDRPVAVVGDVHGRSDLLAALLLELGDLPILVMGDLCDRGDDTPGVLDLLIARGAHGVRGNHEGWFRRWIEGGGLDPFALHSAVGGAATLRAYGVEGRSLADVEAARLRVPDSHLSFIKSLSLVIDLGVCGVRYWLIHAGVPGRADTDALPAEQVVPWWVRHCPDDLLWGTTHPADMPAVDRTVVMGHVALDDPLDTGAVVALDTGAGAFGASGRLTAVVLPERRFVTVGADDVPGGAEGLRIRR